MNYLAHVQTELQFASITFGTALHKICKRIEGREERKKITTEEVDYPILIMHTTHSINI